ncbi:MAG: ABC transporter ATP-binding protein [Bacteroidetes bacterium]|nr:ABC transporter ATP-binding protein [Bacteroidota bacterium]
MLVLLRLAPYFKKYKYRFLLGILFVTISNYCSTAIPPVVGGIINGLSHHHANTDFITTAIIKILFLTAGSGFFMMLTRLCIIMGSRLIEFDVRNDLLRAIEKQNVSFFHEYSTGSLMAHATNDVSALREFIGPAIMYSANTLTTFLFALTLMLQLNTSITLVALFPLPIMAYATYAIGRKVHFAFKDVQEHFGSLTSQVQEALSGVRVVRAYSREEYERVGFNRSSTEYSQKNLRLAKIQSLSMPAMMFLVGLSNVLVLSYGGLQVMNGKALLGDLSQFFIYLNQLIWPVAAIGWVMNLIQRAAASTQRLTAILGSNPEIKDNDITDKNIKTLQGEITFSKVTFQYISRNTPVLTDISLNIPNGTSLGIVGATGHGKSSLVNLIPRLQDVTTGEITIDGHPINTIPLQTLRSSIGIVQQEPFLFSLSIADNIRFGRPEATEEEIIQASKLAALHEDISTLKEGYSTIVGERGITLSGGQKQRTAIARALVRQPKILILDDALSAVDTATEEKILNGLQEVMKNRTTIIIAHRLSTVKNCDKIIVIEEGTIAEEGTHFELIALGKLYAEMYERQQLEQEIGEYGT